MKRTRTRTVKAQNRCYEFIWKGSVALLIFCLLNFLLRPKLFNYLFRKYCGNSIKTGDEVILPLEDLLRSDSTKDYARFEASLEKRVTDASEKFVRITKDDAKSRDIPTAPKQPKSSVKIPDSSAPALTAQISPKSDERFVSSLPEKVVSNAQTIDFGASSSAPISWEAFVRLPVVGSVSQGARLQASPISAAVDTMVQCSQDLATRLSSPVLNKEDFTWCQWALNPTGGGVRVGKSWGKLDRDKPAKERFDDLNCNAVSQGLNPSCDDDWGDRHVINWARNVAASVKCEKGRTSTIQCYDNSNKDRICTMENAQIDFRKYRDIDRGKDRTKSRKFEKSFISADCDHSDGSYFPFPHLYSPTLSSATCDHVVNSTTLMFSHDDFSNIGHTMNDWQNVWLMMYMNNRARYFNSTWFLNIDALKLGHSYQDKIGKFHEVYQHDFKGILRGADFKGSTVCFQRLLIQPVPPKFFVWGSWFKDSTCSLRGPSSLHQRWNLHLRRSFGTLSDNIDYRAPSIRNSLKILFIVRRVTKNLWGTNRSSRNILNMVEVRERLTSEITEWNANSGKKDGVHVEIVFQDLAELSLSQQIELAASSSLIVGTHGAGIVLSNFMPIGRANCCGVLEIYPTGEFSPIRGHGNMARKTGLHYDRMDVGEKASHGDGVTVDPEALWGSVNALLQKMHSQPSCVLPDVAKDPYLELNRG